MKPLYIAVCFLLLATASQAQRMVSFAQSIMRDHKIPELAYAVVSADSVYDMQVLGVRKINTNMRATPTDRFRLGSNTKVVTGFIAALLVKQGKISWDTKFFDLYPELKAGSRKEYHQYTLLDLLTFRTRLFRYTYTHDEPVKGQFTGSADSQRYQFARWFLRYEPLPGNDSINFSNLSYVAAGLMLEKASGKSYKQLVKELGQQLGIEFGFGRPNATDKQQTWGHNAALQPEATAEDYKLDWLLPAGNLNCAIGGYAKFIQLQLKGLKGQSDILSKQEFDFLHFGRQRFAVGWLPAEDAVYGHHAFHIGNPGTYLSKVYVYKDMDRAFILFANAQTDEVDRGLDRLYDELRSVYGRR